MKSSSVLLAVVLASGFAILSNARAAPIPSPIVTFSGHGGGGGSATLGPAAFVAFDLQYPEAGVFAPDACLGCGLLYSIDAIPLQVVFEPGTPGFAAFVAKAVNGIGETLTSHTYFYAASGALLAGAGGGGLEGGTETQRYGLVGRASDLAGSSIDRVVLEPNLTVEHSFSNGAHGIRYSDRSRWALFGQFISLPPLNANGPGTMIIAGMGLVAVWIQRALRNRLRISEFPDKGPWHRGKTGN